MPFGAAPWVADAMTVLSRLPVPRASSGPTSQYCCGRPLISCGGMASMSLGSRHISHGITVATGASRPTLLNSAGLVAGRAHASSPPARSAATAAHTQVLLTLVMRLMLGDSGVGADR